MEEIKLIRANLHELADALTQLLSGKSFTYIYKRWHKLYENDESPLEVTYEQCALQGEKPIEWRIAERSRLGARSSVSIDMKGPMELDHRYLSIHPSVFAGGKNYDDNGHVTWFKVQPGKIEIHDGYEERDYTFQLV